ncbi:hypothetical protein DK847_16750 [Aestuariivirga litoralis]|uniref:Uncharacterized protein n=1 Tax=Aestuariivirga litoralis TaxID=2650924 RepID=A0A2W2BI67_9HYPH|nr:hypothetical protein DK847_16750 [Aestuariivirga litoralis]
MKQLPNLLMMSIAEASEFREELLRVRLRKELFHVGQNFGMSGFVHASRGLRFAARCLPPSHFDRSSISLRLE